jgi:hypothetical protein
MNLYLNADAQIFYAGYFTKSKIPKAISKLLKQIQMHHLKFTQENQNILIGTMGRLCITYQG